MEPASSSPREEHSRKRRADVRAMRRAHSMFKVQQQNQGIQQRNMPVPLRARPMSPAPLPSGSTAVSSSQRVEEQGLARSGPRHSRASVWRSASSLGIVTAAGWSRLVKGRRWGGLDG